MPFIYYITPHGAVNCPSQALASALTLPPAFQSLATRPKGWVCAWFLCGSPSSDLVHQPWHFAIPPSFVHGVAVPTLTFWAPSVFVAASATRCSVENGCGGRADGFLAAPLAFSWLKECPEHSTVWTGISLPAIQPASATLSLQFVTHIWYVFSISLRARLPGDSSNRYLSAAKSSLAFAGPTHGCAVGPCRALGGSAGPPKQRGVNQQHETPYHQPPFSTRGGLLL